MPFPFAFTWLNALHAVRHSHKYEIFRSGICIDLGRRESLVGCRRFFEQQSSGRIQFVWILICALQDLLRRQAIGQVTNILEKLSSVTLHYKGLLKPLEDDRTNCFEHSLLGFILHKTAVSGWDLNCHCESATGLAY
jgi:hypothetical protein